MAKEAFWKRFATASLVLMLAPFADPRAWRFHWAGQQEQTLPIPRQSHVDSLKEIELRKEMQKLQEKAEALQREIAAHQHEDPVRAKLSEKPDSKPTPRVASVVIKKKNLRTMLEPSGVSVGR